MSPKDEPFEISQEWREAIARRCRGIDEGAVTLIPGDQVLKEAIDGLRR